MRTLKLMFLVLTLLPLGYALYFLGTFNQNVSHEQFDILFNIHIIVTGLTWTLLASYIYFVFKLKSINENRRSLWAITIFMGSIVAMPVFWFLHIWPAQNIEND